MSYPEVVGTPPIPEKFQFAHCIREPHLSLGSTLTLFSHLAWPSPLFPHPQTKKLKHFQSVNQVMGTSWPADGGLSKKDKEQVEILGKEWKDV